VGERTVKEKEFTLLKTVQCSEFRRGSRNNQKVVRTLNLIVDHGTTSWAVRGGGKSTLPDQRLGLRPVFHVCIRPHVIGRNSRKITGKNRAKGGKPEQGFKGYNGIGIKTGGVGRHEQRREMNSKKNISAALDKNWFLCRSRRVT